MDLQRNTILITGGTSGFGLEFATRLSAMGNTVIITGRNAEKLAKTKALHPQLHTFQSDVSDPVAIQSLYDAVTAQFPDLNILINNAGIMKKYSLHAVNPGLADEIYINLLGPIRMIEQFLPHLKLKEKAAILNVTSGLALTPFPLSPVYGASKSGLRSFTRSLRVQLRHTTVKVFELIAPAANTPLTDEFAGIDAGPLMDPEKLIDSAIKGMQRDKVEIYPGVAKALHILSRLAPGFLLKQLSRPGADYYMAK